MVKRNSSLGGKVDPEWRRAYAATPAPEPCKFKPPCGERCCLDPDVDHELHICRNPSCLCHSRERYEGRLP
jgi:hypothetical protein